ncbi:MAG: DUF58 domain-containing protein [Deltaproteobacteria bacterium]|nr:DUF58 domain-containing protein [Deltaproteobacteria bacterium]
MLALLTPFYRVYRERIRPSLRRARDLFPLTPLGLFVACFGALALFHYGYQRIDLFLLVVGLVCLGLVAVSMVLSVAGAVVLGYRTRGRSTEDALNLECGFSRRTGFSVGAPWFVPFLRVGWSWVTPHVDVKLTRRGLRIEEEVTPTKRTLADEVRRRFEVGDTFGFTRVSFERVEERPVRFLPTTGALKQMQVLRTLAAGDAISHPDGPAGGERMDMRHYVPGDPVRFILWKVFARSREIVIRTPERAIGPSHQTVAYVVTGPADEPAAGAARVAVDAGALGADWVLGADGCEGYAEDLRSAHEVLARSGDATETSGGAGLGDFLKTATPGGLGRALVFVPARPGPWIDRVLLSLGRTKGDVEVVVCTDGVDRGAKKGGRWGRFLYRPDDSPGPAKGVGPAAAADVTEVCRRLSAGRVRVLILDRMAGQVYSAAHQLASEAA